MSQELACKCTCDAAQVIATSSDEYSKSLAIAIIFVFAVFLVVTFFAIIINKKDKKEENNNDKGSHYYY
jgi:preprotein translocase subunit SecG